MFEYILMETEVVIINIRSIDDNDAKLLISERYRSKEYNINGKNILGRMISISY